MKHCFVVMESTDVKWKKVVLFQKLFLKEPGTRDIIGQCYLFIPTCIMYTNTTGIVLKHNHLMINISAENLEIIMVTESWVNMCDEHQIGEAALNGCNVFIKCCLLRSSGCILLYNKSFILVTFCLADLKLLIILRISIPRALAAKLTIGKELPSVMGYDFCVAKTLCIILYFVVV